MASRNTVQEIKEKISIIDVVQPYVKLVRTGKYWKGLSPFNKENTPSFFVSPERGTYHCFSSGQGGDMFTFIEKMEGVDFKGALSILAEKAGVEVKYERGGSKDNSRIDRMREAIARAEQFYAQLLVPDSDAYVYARKRGITEKTINEWGIGYAPEGWRRLLEMLTAESFSTEELVMAGLIKEADAKPGTFYDRFRNRLMFPIRDTAGRTVAFTGRALSEDESAKYLNSPETDLFKKSEIIFGMNKAKDAIRTRGFALLVEGQMDVIHCHQAGFTNAIALSGTALSSRHVELIKRYADNLMLVFDGDNAGLSATKRSAELALFAGMHVKAVSLPDGKDPADLISADAKEFSTRVAEARSVIEFFLSTLSAKETDMQKLVQLVETIVLPLVKAVKSPLEREHFVGVVAHALATTSEAVRESLSTIQITNAQDTQDSVTAIKSIATNADTKRSISSIRAEALSAIVESYPESPLADKIQSEYSRIMGEESLPEPSEQAIFEAGISFGENPTLEDVDDLIRAFERSWLDEQYTKALNVLRRAQVSRDTKEETRAEIACADLVKRIAECEKN
ncbi:DNA primase [hydrothermal vent metagenome]|uniref:DNA primase n=1 Tax=hydrothermal vent metagenome TaxID=652676 RepID=A0A3B0UZH2_9ZZZZ